MHQPFTARVDADAIADLRARLRHTRWPEAAPVEDWSQGIPLDYLRSVCAYWADGYDMSRLAARLNRHPQFVAAVDGVDIHFLHVRAPVDDAPALVMTHGWPGSVVEFLNVIEPLTNPVAHGGNAEDAFHLVVPALPGYGFSGRPATTGWGVERIADAWCTLMRSLGYERFLAQGGDWGAAVTTAVGARHPEHCAGLHVNMPLVVPRGELLENLTDPERDALAGREFYQRWDSGYSKQQSTRPQTVGYGLVDSPAALAGWILEKFYQWTDCDGHPENAIDRDQLIDNLMMYWLPGAGASSARLYWESFGRADYADVNVPSGASIFPKEIFRASERWVQSRYRNLVYFNTLERGGHFAAFEQPDVFVDEVRRCFARMR